MSTDTTPMKKPTVDGNPAAGSTDKPIVCEAQIQAKPLRLSPREFRVAHALAGAYHWISREQLDRTAGSSNSPDLIFRLRSKLGESVIETRHVDAIDRDGRACRPGQYRLAEQHRAVVVALLAEVAA